MNLQRLNLKRLVGRPHLLGRQRGPPLRRAGKRLPNIRRPQLALHQEIGSAGPELGLDGLVIVDDGDDGEAMERGAATFPRQVRVATPSRPFSTAAANGSAQGDQPVAQGQPGRLALGALITLLEAHFPNVTASRRQAQSA